MSSNPTKTPSLFFESNAQRKAMIADNRRIPENPIQSLLDIRSLKLDELKTLNEELCDVEITDIAALRPFLPTLLSFYQQELYKIDPVSLAFIHALPKKRQEIERQLLFTIFILQLKLKLDEAEGRNYTLSPLKKQLDYSFYLLSRLEIGLINTPAKQLEVEIGQSEKPAAYLGFFAAELITDFIDWFINNIEDLKSAKTVTLIQWMSSVNERRLYWVWGGGMLQSIFDALPQHMEHLDQARKGLAVPSPYTGYMSWVLYFTRMGINLFMVAKHTIPGSWMTEEERLIPIGQRFLTQWHLRKFSILNDLVWGLVNMACFFWWYGPGKAGYVGNIATAGLLLVDLCLNLWRLVEEQTKYNKFKHEMTLAQKGLRQQIIDLNLKQLQRSEEEKKNEMLLAAFQAKIAKISGKIEENDRLMDDAAREWEFKYAGLINDVSYSAGLLVAFCFMCCFLVPPAAIAPATILAMGITGAVMSFILTAATAVINGSLEVAKLQDAHEETKTKRLELIEQFKNPVLDENERKLIYLDILALGAKSAYQLEMAHFQKMQVIRALCVDALIPVIVFASLIFMPLGIGLGVMGAGLALIIVSKIIVNQMAPKSPELEQLPDLSEKDRAVFNSKRMAMIEHEYDAFEEQHLAGELKPSLVGSEPPLFFPRQEKRNQLITLVEKKDDGIEKKEGLPKNQ